VATLNHTGSVVERYAYTPYGVVTYLDEEFDNPSTASSIGNEYLYTGRRRDTETGLQLNRNRYYHSQLGRWITRDPIGYAGGINLYRYLSSGPLESTDPYGLVEQGNELGLPTVNNGFLRIIAVHENLGKRACVEPARISWRFQLLGHAPCDGFLLQKVTVDCSVQTCKCKEGDEEPPVQVVYYEKWDIARGGVDSVHLDRDPSHPFALAFTDTAQFTPPNNTKGSYEQGGEVRFFCYAKNSDGTKNSGGIPKQAVDTFLSTRVRKAGAGPCGTTSGKLEGRVADTDPGFWGAI
jgi:RHS repeat-associated protein